MSLRLLKLIGVALCIALFLRLFIFEGIYVASSSMEPTLYKGMYLFLDKVSLRLRAPRHGEIVVFPSPVDGKKDLIKRVIALPGDEIHIQNKVVFLNGKPFKEVYVRFSRINELLKGDNVGPLRVPKGKLFVMGDNRDESGDSRDWQDPRTGDPVYFINVNTIKGRVLLLF